MDDPTAELPLDPPALPADNASQLRALKSQLDMLSSSPTDGGRVQAEQAALAMGDLWKAESIARTVSSQSPNYRMAQLALASSLRQQARYGSAEQIYKQLLAHDNRDSDAYLGLADTGVCE